jgi:hypothetical protein
MRKRRSWARAWDAGRDSTRSDPVADNGKREEMDALFATRYGALNREAQRAVHRTAEDLKAIDELQVAVRGLLVRMSLVEEDTIELREATSPDAIHKAQTEAAGPIAKQLDTVHQEVVRLLRYAVTIGCPVCGHRLDQQELNEKLAPTP